MWARQHLAVFFVLATLIASVGAIVLVASPGAATGLLPFHSYDELAAYLTDAQSASQSAGLGSGATLLPPRGGAAAPRPGSPAYSGTNVQVAGVDELDRVKTDGQYLYVASEDQVTIFLAYPATDLHVVHQIPLVNLTQSLTDSDTISTVGLFLNGPHLVVVADVYTYTTGGYAYAGTPSPLNPAPGMAPRATLRVAPEDTFAFLFDVSDPAGPVLEHTIAITGMASTGRMVGSTVYLVASQWIPDINGTYLPPVLCVDGACRAVAPSEIYADTESKDAWDYTNLLALNVETGAAKPMSLVTGGTSTLYMSPTAMYLGFYKWTVSASGPAPMIAPVRWNGGWTTLYRLEASGLDITPTASADVDGTLLSQYSLDEWNGTLRVATTVRNFGTDGTTEYSNVYAFDLSLALLGSVKDLAPGESIFAVRFLEDHAYVVTYQKIDPLFVIDLSDPSSPVVSGFLEMPGFSQYLYPIDAGHLVGVGKDALPAEGNFSWYQGLKLSLYDVTNASDPREASNVSLGDRGTQSEVLYDPHAFLYIPDRQYIVLPVDLALVDPSQYPGGVPDWAYGTVVWQGAYVFQVNATAGFTYVGRIAHGNGTINATSGWYGSPTQIRRSLYIGDVLYTVSATEVLASSLADLSEIAHVVYASPPGCPYCGPIVLA